MPKPKTLDAATARKALRYLDGATNDPLRKHSLFNDDADDEKAVATLRNFSSAKPDCQALRVWIDQYMAPDARRRMWAALRQQRHAVRRNVQRLPLGHDTYSNLAAYAKKHELTLAGAVSDLLQRANGKRKR